MFVYIHHIMNTIQTTYLIILWKESWWSQFDCRLKVFRNRNECGVVVRIVSVNDIYSGTGRRTIVVDVIQQ